MHHSLLRKEVSHVKRTEMGTLRFEAQGYAITAGGRIPYRALSQEFIFLGENNQPEASIFSFSYIRSDVSEKDLAKRPVVFAFNGGPGSSCVWLHLGFMGPTRVKLECVTSPSPVPPFELEENPHCMLDICDIVMIDPVGTGYARLYNEQAEKAYYGIDEDAASIAHFIEDWLTRHDRWQSPKYIMGESYGTLRCGVLASALMGGPTSHSGRVAGIPIDGVIMLGTSFMDGRETEKIDPALISLPSIAATHWYHSKGQEPGIESFVEEAYEFACQEYAGALLLGNRLNSERRSAIAAKLEYFTGVPASFFHENRLRIDTKAFLEFCCKERSMEVGLYDSRYLLPRKERLGTVDPIADDGAMGQYTPAFVSAMNGPKKRELGIETDRLYNVILIKDVNSKWNYKSVRTPLESLSAAMRRNKRLRVFFGSGYYDLVTVFGYVRYLVSQDRLPMDRVVMREYASGHMPYLGEESARSLASDLRGFIVPNLTN